MTTRLVLDPGARLVVRTRAKGLFGKLAHDLELEGQELLGSLELEGEGYTGSLSFTPPRVGGVLKGDRVDRTVLSASDRRDIEERIKKDAFPGVARAEVSVRGPSHTRGTATLRLAGPTATAELTVRATPKGAGFEVRGSARVSLSRLGVPEIKGPLGAFKVADEVEIELTGSFSPSAM